MTFVLSNSNKLHLIFPADGGCALVPEVEYENVLTAAAFKKFFPIALTVVPVLGPLENRELRKERSTVISGLATHRASRHFRNYWHYFHEDFESFSQLIEKTWPGMQIRPPELDQSTGVLSMFCLEGRLTRELFWVGFGFQIWCQLLTHLSRSAESSLTIVDEPEIYLHPDVQRQLLAIIRDIGVPVIMATHSSEIMSEAEPADIVLIDKKRRSGERLKDVSSVQRSLDLVGSSQNITLTALARSRRVLFVEGDMDFKIIRRFARKIGMHELSAGIGLTSINSEGFSSWERITTLAAGISEVLGSPLMIAAIYDRDYYCNEAIAAVEEALSKHLKFAHFHQRKEIENYLLLPSTLQRAISRARAARASTNPEKKDEFDVFKVLYEITEPLKGKVQSQITARRWDHLKSSGKDLADISAETLASFEPKWSKLETRLEIVPGKDVLAQFRTRLQQEAGLTLTDTLIIETVRKEEIPVDLLGLLEKLDSYRVMADKPPPP